MEAHLRLTLLGQGAESPCILEHVRSKFLETAHRMDTGAAAVTESAAGTMLCGG